MVVPIIAGILALLLNLFILYKVQYKLKGKLKFIACSVYIIIIVLKFILLKKLGLL